MKRASLIVLALFFCLAALPLLSAFWTPCEVDNPDDACQMIVDAGIPLYTDPTVLGTKSYALIDLTGDGEKDILVKGGTCGASTCFPSFHILSNHTGTLENVVCGQGEDESISMSSAHPTIKDVTGDGIAEVSLTGGTITSAAAGRQRKITSSWSWNGTCFGFLSTQLAPTNYRHLILYEANDLFAEERYEEARKLYEQVINDQDLMDDAIGAYNETRQFAAFRLSLLEIVTSEKSTETRTNEGWLGRIILKIRNLFRNEPYYHSNKWTVWLEENYPRAGATKGSFALMKSWQSSQNLSKACSAATIELRSYGNPAGSLANMGYKNPSLGAEDFCPIR